MKVIYYNVYLFYAKKIWGENNPHNMSMLFISFIEWLICVGVLEYFAAYFYCTYTSNWITFSIYFLIAVINNFIFIKPGFADKIIKQKPTYFNSKLISKILTVMILISSFVIYLYSRYIAKNILDKCN